MDEGLGFSTVSLCFSRTCSASSCRVSSAVALGVSSCTTSAPTPTTVAVWPVSRSSLSSGSVTKSPSVDGAVGSAEDAEAGGTEREAGGAGAGLCGFPLVCLLFLLPRLLEPLCGEVEGEGGDSEVVRTEGAANDVDSSSPPSAAEDDAVEVDGSDGDGCCR